MGRLFLSAAMPHKCDNAEFEVMPTQAGIAFSAYCHFNILTYQFAMLFPVVPSPMLVLFGYYSTRGCTFLHPRVLSLVFTACRCFAGIGSLDWETSAAAHRHVKYKGH